MPQSETVSKGRKKLVEKIISNARNMSVFTLQNNFCGENIEHQQSLRSALAEFKSTKLFHVGNGHYQIHVHSNRWYEFDSIGRDQW